MSAIKVAIMQGGQRNVVEFNDINVALDYLAQHVGAHEAVEELKNLDECQDSCCEGFEGEPEEEEGDCPCFHCANFAPVEDSNLVWSSEIIDDEDDGEGLTCDADCSQCAAVDCSDRKGCAESEFDDIQYIGALQLSPQVFEDDEVTCVTSRGEVITLPLSVFERFFIPTSTMAAADKHDVTDFFVGSELETTQIDDTHCACIAHYRTCLDQYTVVPGEESDDATCEEAAKTFSEDIKKNLTFMKHWGLFGLVDVVNPD